MKWLAFLVIFAVVLPIYGQEESPKANRSTNPVENHQQPKTNATPTEATIKVNVVHQEKADNEQNSSENGAKKYFSHLFSPENLPNIGLLVAAILGLVVGFRTIRDTRTAANAALLNAQAVITAERAWIAVLPYIWSPEFYPKWEKGDPVPEGPLAEHPISHCFRAQIKNVGRTPAKIEGIAIHYISISENPSRLGAEPDYGELDTKERLLVPNEEMLATGLLTPDSGTLTKAQIRDIADEKEFLYAYGIVRYRDVYEHSHETRFGYVYHSPERYFVMKEGKVETVSFDKAVFRRGGPTAYNRNT